MNLTHFNWSIFIAEVTGIPTDVIFQILEDGQLHEIEAHKIVLGMVSPTFKAMFYTTDVGDKNTNKIKIKETTYQAFQIIIDDLYKIKSIKDSLQGKSIQEIFDVVNLIERYQMKNFQEAITEMLAKYPITDDTVLEVAAEAIDQSRLFQKEAHLLLVTCAKFLKPKLNYTKTIFKYMEENEDKKEVVAALLARMNGLPPTECSNCGYEGCQDGKEVLEGQFRVGLLVTNNEAVEWYWGCDSDMGTGKVANVEGGRVYIKHVKRGVTGEHFNPRAHVNGEEFPKRHGGENLFFFMCN